jgi:hypothetical protein
MFITQRYAVGAQPLRSETRVRNGCVIVITQPLRSHYAQGNLLMEPIQHYTGIVEAFPYHWGTELFQASSGVQHQPEK